MVRKARAKQSRSSYLPAPEGPVREDDVERLVVAAVSEKRRQDGGVLPLVLAGADDGPVHAVEHEVEVGHAARVAAEQLEEIGRASCRERVFRAV